MEKKRLLVSLLIRVQTSVSHSRPLSEHLKSDLPQLLSPKALAGPNSLWSSLHAKSLQSCPALCSPMDRSPPGSSVCGILQARMNTGVGYHALLQGIIPTQGYNPQLLSLLLGSLPLAPPGKPLVHQP